MRAAVRLALFAGVLAVVATLAALAGAALEPDAPGRDADAEPAHGAAAGAAARVVAATDGFRAGERRPFRFRVVDARGRALTDFEVEHERRMHLIVVRRDLSGYQHLHPRARRDGTWEVPLRLDEPGAYRLFADFRAQGRPQTLGVDVIVPGDFRPRALPRPAVTASAGDGYRVRLAGEGGDVRFLVSRNGRAVGDLEPYLGARGHLVAIRDGDLAYLHVHPEDDPTPGRDIRFRVDYPAEGRYRLFLQFKHEGRVRRAELTTHSTAIATEQEEEQGAHGH